MDGLEEADTRGEADKAGGLGELALKVVVVEHPVNSRGVLRLARTIRVLSFISGFIKLILSKS